MNPRVAFRLFARWVRHSPALAKAEGLWSILRRPYLALLDAGGKGVSVCVAGRVWVRMPAEYAAGAVWEDYEPETVAALADWMCKHPGGQVFDVGCSIGIFSAVALFADCHSNIVAFDSDLNSLAAARRLCRYAPGDRLQVVWGFLGDKETVVQALHDAFFAANEALERQSPSGKLGTNRYICLDKHDKEGIPCRKLDDLLQRAKNDPRPLLIKCDVEGAELIVLSGSRRLLQGNNISLLLSVHPTALPNHGHSVEDVRLFLKDVDYTITVLGVDHEEHWWCEKRKKGPAS